MARFRWAQWRALPAELRWQKLWGVVRRRILRWHSPPAGYALHAPELLLCSGEIGRALEVPEERLPLLKQWAERLRRHEFLLFLPCWIPRSAPSAPALDLPEPIRSEALRLARHCTPGYHWVDWHTDPLARPPKRGCEDPHAVGSRSQSTLGAGAITAPPCTGAACPLGAPPQGGCLRCRTSDRTPEPAPGLPRGESTRARYPMGQPAGGGSPPGEPCNGGAATAGYTPIGAGCRRSAPPQHLRARHGVDAHPGMEGGLARQPLPGQPPWVAGRRCSAGQAATCRCLACVCPSGSSSPRCCSSSCPTAGIGRARSSTTASPWRWCSLPLRWC
jgi:hypothetical protein